MTYTQLLNRLIDSSGLQLKEIAEKCNMQGENITASYISVLKNTEGRSASESVSRAIAKACGAPYDDLLVVQAFLDNAPESIVKLLSDMKETTFTAGLTVIENAFPQIPFEELKKEFEKLSLAEFVCEASRQQQAYNVLKDSRILETAINVFSSTMILDNSMEPLIPKGSKIEIEFLQEMKTGEIVHYKNIKNDESKIRLCSEVLDDCWTFIPLQREYESETLTKDEFILLGKVKAVTHLI